MNTRQVRFDDVKTLRELISEEFGPWGPDVTVTQEMINRFADLTADHQWIHVDVERAKKGPFGVPIAHGFLTLGLMAKLQPKLRFDVVGEGSRVHYGCENFRFLVPVPAGATLHARTRLTKVREHEQGTLLIKELSAHIVGNDRPSLVYNGMLLYRP
jgi:acyl dehydratase